MFRAGQNACGEKAAFLGKNIVDSSCKNIRLLVMDDWLCSQQPITAYQSQGFTTGASYHALCYFEYHNLFFAVDLNTNQQGVPYMQIFVSDRQSDLLQLLNAIYACKNIYLLDIHEEWWKIYNSKKTKEFASLISIDTLSSEYPVKSIFSEIVKPSQLNPPADIKSPTLKMQNG